MDFRRRERERDLPSVVPTLLVAVCFVALMFADPLLAGDVPLVVGVVLLVVEVVVLVVGDVLLVVGDVSFPI